MKEIVSDQIRREYTFIKALGIVVLTFLMMIGIVGATPFAYISHLNNNVSVISSRTEQKYM